MVQQVSILNTSVTLVTVPCALPTQQRPLVHTIPILPTPRGARLLHGGIVYYIVLPRLVTSW